jgi:regulator of sirC expression with transglutaminase-like and TPR domain
MLADTTRSATDEMIGGVSQRFRDLVAVADEAVDLARAALEVARIEYPAVDVDHYLRELDAIAEHVHGGLAPDAGVEDTLRAINRHLFADLKFSGNADEYYDPRNSYLNDVLDRRLGIPISLSVLYLEVGWRLGLAMQGVSFPGHFLVKLSVDNGEIVLDPYSGGVSLGKEDLELRLLGVVQPNRTSGQFDLAQYLEAAPRKEILHRMLRNLKAIHLQNEDDVKSLAVIEHMLCLRAADNESVRDRGIVYARLGCFGLAVDDFARYLKSSPEAEDADDIRGRMVEAQRSAMRLH